MRRVLLIVMVLTLTGCAVLPRPVAPAPAPASSTESAPTVTKLLVFVVENHSLKQMQAGMPYTFAQAQRFGYATHYRAVRHPSLPNYISIIGGRPHGIVDDKPPSAHKIRGRSVFGQALKAGRTVTVYADGMSTTCATADGGTRYAVRHNPWTYFVDERASCRRHDVPVSRLSRDITEGALPNVGMVIPNKCNDAHDCPLATADQWFRTWMTRIYAGKDWKSGHLAVVLTADEDDHSSHNTVLTVVIHPRQHHRVVDAPLTHYSLTRLYDDVAHVSRLNVARDAASMSTAFGVPL
jgi:acid phosphatase